MDCWPKSRQLEHPQVHELRMKTIIYRIGGNMMCVPHSMPPQMSQAQGAGRFDANAALTVSHGRGKRNDTRQPWS